MAESTPDLREVFSPQQPPKYFKYLRVRFRRAGDDTVRALGARVRLVVVYSVCAAIVTSAISYYAGKPEEMSTALYFGLLGIAGFFGGWSLTFLAYFFGYFLIAPSRIYKEDQREIADLKSQLDLQLNLHVTVSSVSPMDPGAFRDLQLSQNGLVIFLQDIRFTNRSKTNKVSLDLTLMVPGRGGDYRVTEGKEHWEVFHSYFLFTPIDIDPQRTRSGNMCFLVSPETVRNCGGKWKLNYKQCRLKIFDTVSEKTMDKDISQEAWESQQSIRDVPVWHNEE